MADSKTLGDAFAELVKAAEPAFKQLSKDVEEAARIGHERFKQRSEELEHKRSEIDTRISRHWRRRP